jgi:hypothetical protein
MRARVRIAGLQITKLQKASLVPQEYSWITWAKAAKDLLRICLVSP